MGEAKLFDMFSQRDDGRRITGTDLCTIKIERAECCGKSREKSLNIALREEAVAGNIAGQVEVDEACRCRVGSEEVDDTFARKLSASAEIEVRELCRTWDGRKCPICDPGMRNIEVGKTRYVT